METSAHNPITHEDESPTEDCTPEPGEQGFNDPQWRALLDLGLHFFSSSSTEILLAAFVALIGATYVILGRLGLLLIGIASGIALHASWEGMYNEGIGGLSEERNSKRRRELALNIANRVLDWPQQKPTAIDAESGPSQTRLRENGPSLEFDCVGSLPETVAALQLLTDAVLRDYVNYWYKPILPSDNKFPASCREVLVDFISSVSSHLSRKRTADAFLEFLTNSSSMAIVFLNELSTAFQVIQPSTSPEQTVRRYLEQYPESSLANVLVETQQQKKLNMIADDILSGFLDSRVYDCLPARDFLREMLAGVVLESIVSSLSRPEFINGWIIHLFNEGESEIMNAIDAGVESARAQGVAAVKDPADIAIMRTATQSTGAESKPPKIAKESTEAADKATEEAVIEAKRLSAMIAAHSTSKHAISTTDSGDINPNSNPTTIQSSDGIETSPHSGSTRAEMVHDAPYSNMAQLSSRESSPQSSAAPNESSPQNPASDQNSSPLTTTLHHAAISVDDGSEPGGKSLLRSKPTSDYMLQIEPASTRCTGWMVFRRYADFESLHEALETISRLNKIEHFAESHPTLPAWKGQTRHELAKNLERYLHDALRYEPLAESARMRRFFEKDGGAGEPTSTVKSGFSFPSQLAFENMGKGVLDVLSNAPKGVSGGGRSVFDGVTGVFGSGSVKKQSNSPGIPENLRVLDGNPSEPQAPLLSPLKDNEAQRRVTDSFEFEGDGIPDLQNMSRSEPISAPLGCLSMAENDHDDKKQSNSDASAAVAAGTTVLREPMSPDKSQHGAPTSDEKTSLNQSRPAGRKSPPITQEETRIAVELIFAVINELYTLSSAWNIRRTLLNAAKSYILRPGNPNLETIRGLLQESMIDANTSDEILASYILKLRENALPTEAELASWPPPPDDAEKTRLRDTARKALTQRGLPQALTSVMGAAASREALEKVFDCLQIEPIARGLVFSVLLQALRAMIL